jgi:hypothetical protein
MSIHRNASTDRQQSGIPMLGQNGVEVADDAWLDPGTGRFVENGIPKQDQVGFTHKPSAVSRFRFPSGSIGGKQETPPRQ